MRLKILLGLPLCLLLVLKSYAEEKPAIDFGKLIRPILSENCFHCHGPDANTREADLRLDQADSALAVIDLNDTSESELLRRIFSSDPDEMMPPPDSERELSKQQKELIKSWIKQGAKYEQHWAFIPPQKPKLPQVKNKSWVKSPIDHFVLTKLEEVQLTPNSTAEKRTLIRRVSLDLTGLPPTLQQIEEFLADDSSAAYEKMIDRLLASEKYGEHMAVSWLELARYADTDGYQNDRYRYMHPWRDWVIMAFNENKPYDEFLLEQLSGDMLPNASLKQQIATGFCRNHRINSEDGSIPAEWHVENVVDRVDTFGTALLGLTIACARCHDHKYDPISQKEYYQLFAYFNNVPEWGIGPNNGNSPPFIEVPESWPQLTEEQNQRIEPEPVKLRNARKTAGNGLKRPQPGSPKTVMVMQEMETPRDTFLLERGQYNMPNKNERLWPAVPQALSQLPQQPKDRLELAQWLCSPENPLTARVAVNRMWQHFFGTGIVATSENFGSQGELPSHPELLDYLAVRFIELDWDVKALQKEVLLSATYQQASSTTVDKLNLDPKNRWLSRGPRFRMTGFMLRDQALAVSGLLSKKMYGPSSKPYMPPNIWKSISNNRYVQDKGENLYRRSLYTYWRRTIPPPTMTNFNAAAREVCTVRTELTNTPLQALTLMNNITFMESARGLAQRMIQLEEKNPSEKIRYGFQLTTGRLPEEKELHTLKSALQEFQSQYEQDSAAAKDLLAIGSSARDDEISIESHAAYTMLASILLNLDETITKQ